MVKDGDSVTNQRQMVMCASLSFLSSSFAGRVLFFNVFRQEAIKKLDVDTSSSARHMACSHDCFEGKPCI